MIWKCSSFNFDLRKPLIMGILNLTPDSFSDGGSYATLDDALRHARRMMAQGAQIIDVGGESTRPGSSEVFPDEELNRVLETVRILAAEGICVSIDTRHAQVAEACLCAGASIVNDVSGFRDPAMVGVAVKSDVGLVVMHMQGEPKTMQEDPQYDDVVDEVREYLVKQAKMLEASGVRRERICIDPGPGFGKTAKQTRELLLNLHEFARTGYPVMAAVSRKRYLRETYGIENLTDLDGLSAEEALQAVELGASIVRTHNVEATARAGERLRPYVYLGLGGNVALVGAKGEEQEAIIAQLNQAVTSLCLLPDTQLIDISSFYESEPAYVETRDPFVNAVVKLCTGLEPEELLNHLHSIEDSLGRVRGVGDGSRTCDLDILDYRGRVVKTPELTLPHPRMLERDFVVRPLLELAPSHILADGTPVTYDSVEVGKATRIR